MDEVEERYASIIMDEAGEYEERVKGDDRGVVADAVNDLTTQLDSIAEQYRRFKAGDDDVESEEEDAVDGSARKGA